MESARTKILHVCTREHLRPLRDAALRGAGYIVESASDSKKAMSLLCAESYDMVLIDVENDLQIPMAEDFCEHARKALPNSIVAFACNWQVSIHSQCPDDVVHTEFNPAAFVSGVRQLLAPK
jgi:CheY-like chemotaxis protein